MAELVLSLFPGIGLLDRAFEEEGFCVVRGPDLLWGGDIHTFHPPVGKFDGVIGGPPCQAFSRLRHMVEANGYKTAPDLIPEFARVVKESSPRWYLMENVPDAPDPSIPHYDMVRAILSDHWVGGKTSRKRRFWFGTRDQCARLHIETLALHETEPVQTVLATAGGRLVPVAKAPGGRPKKTAGKSPLRFETLCELQGMPPTFLSDAPFTATAKRRVLGNGVPLPTGRAVAKAVKRTLGG